MSNTKVEDAILQAIDMIASKRVASAGYNKTILVTIISCLDENIGKYKAKYQDGIFYVYGDPDTYYGPGLRVQVLVPNGDMSKDKTIMGSVQKLGSGYKTLSNEERIYDTIGRNVILNSEYVSVNLSSYKTYDPPMILYDKSAPLNNVLEIDVQLISEYIKRSSTIALSAKFSTDLETSQRYQGDYGIVLGLNFKDNATEDIITRYYVMNIDTMTGNPYFFPNPVLQTKFFEIDNENFILIDTISAFAKDFPIKDLLSSLYDIHIRDFSLKCVEILNAEDLQSYSLNLITSKGYIFNSNSLLDDTRTIEAQLRVQSKLVNMDSKEISIYWFIQNVGVTAASLKYNKYGGQGWQCLNQYHVIKLAVYEGNTLVLPRVIEYISGSKIFSVKKSLVLARETKYKCVVLYGGNILSKLITILRKDAEYLIFITSDSGTQFYYDIGSPTLTCSCYHRENDLLVLVDPKDLNFIWGATDSSGVFLSLPNHSSNSDKSKLNGIRLAIENYLKILYILFEDNYDVDKIFPSDVSIAQIQDAGIKAGVTTVKNRLKLLGILSTQNITQLFAVYNVDASSSITYSVVLYGDSTHTNNLIRIINSMNDSQTVVNNRIFDVNVRRITGFTVFKCSVFTALGSGFLGTADITITNSLTAESSYSLVINNGTQVFKYNTHGIAPTSKRNLLPLQIPSLSFTIYDGLGRPIEDDIASHCDISWIVPTKRTLLKISDNYNGYPDSSLSNMIYKNLMSFNYNIVEIYNTSATLNNITLKVDYNGMHLITSTNLTFTKLGDDGTNGTDFVCKIVPTVDRGDTPLYPTIYYDGNSVTKNWDPGVGNPWFQVQVWNNGNEPIFTGTETGHSTEGKLVTVVKWEVLRNVYSDTKADGTNLTVTAGSSNSNWSFGFSPLKFATETAANWQNWRPANILKVTINYDGHAYYATLPVIVCCYQNSTYQNSYRINLKEYSGFRRVLYNSSGLIPLYDNHAPFEIKVELQISNGNWEDISTKTKTHSMIYRWYYMGSIWYRTNLTTWVLDYEQTIEGANPITNVLESSKKWLLKSNYRDFIENDNGKLQKNQKSIKPADKYDGECVNTGLGCKIIRLSDNQIIGWIHIPIHMSFNRFENSAINSWDGNSVNLGGDNGGMILAPQVGAGIKDLNNRFTGLFMGTAKDPSTDSYGNTASTNEDVGLFGYNAGVRTIFLDSKTGKAVFGAQGQSQIILDPSLKDSNGRPIAQIKSGNYVLGANGSGLMIDLTTPAIKFGSGNFSVDKDGNLKAKNAYLSNALVYGKIHATLLILDDKLSADDIEGLTDISAYFDSNGVLRAVAGDTPASGKTGFTVAKNGLLQASNAVIWGGIYASYGTIAGFTFSNTTNTGTSANGGHVYTNSLYAHSSNYDDNNATTKYEWEVGIKGDGNNATAGNTNLAFYTKRIAQGAQWSTAFTPFYVRKNGLTQWSNGSQSLVINPNGGNIFVIKNGNTNKIWMDSSGNAHFDGAVTATSLTLGNNAIIEKGNTPALGVNGFKVETNGLLKASNAIIWGKLYTSEGKIGGWTIDSSSIYSGTKTADSSVIISSQNFTKTINRFDGTYDTDNLRMTFGQNFAVDKNGKLYATNAEISGRILADSGYIGGWEIGSPSLYAKRNNTKLINFYSGLWNESSGWIDPYISCRSGYNTEDEVRISGGQILFKAKIYNQNQDLLNILPIGIDGDPALQFNCYQRFVIGQYIGSDALLFTPFSGNAYGRFRFRAEVLCKDDLKVLGQKNRIVQTDNYGRRALYTYESTSPYFSDIGTGYTDENGLCYISIDEIFSETICLSSLYQVFLQKEGKGDLWVEKKLINYFLVKGTANLKFSWEIKVLQKEYLILRLLNENFFEDKDNNDLEILLNYIKELKSYS